MKPITEDEKQTRRLWTHQETIGRRKPNYGNSARLLTRSHRFQAVLTRPRPNADVERLAVQPPRGVSHSPRFVSGPAASDSAPIMPDRVSSRTSSA